MMFLLITKMTLFSFVTFFDIVSLGLLCFWIYIRLKGTIGLRISLGLFILYGIFWLLKLLGFQLMTALLSQLMEFSALAIVILFQQEIRTLLFRLGQTYSFRQFLLQWRFFGKKTDNHATAIHIILQAVQMLQKNKLGAILVLSKYDSLKMYEATGELLHAKISARLLMAIFCKSSPLHDGAVLIHADKITAAGCILPVTDRLSISPTLGLRHRAAMGLAETTNVIVLVVSEESGQLSIALGNKIYKHILLHEVHHLIKKYLIN